MSRWREAFSWKQLDWNLLRLDPRFAQLWLVTTRKPSRLSSRYMSINFAQGTIVGCSRRLHSKSQRFWVDFSCLLIKQVISSGEKVDLLPLAQDLKFTTRVRLIFSCAIERARPFSSSMTMLWLTVHRRNLFTTRNKSQTLKRDLNTSNGQGWQRTFFQNILRVNMHFVPQRALRTKLLRFFLKKFNRELAPHFANPGPGTANPFLNSIWTHDGANKLHRERTR